MTPPARISEQQLAALRLALGPLIGEQFKSLSLPAVVVKNIEPSQVGTIVGTLMDALLPHLPGIPQVGLQKHEGIQGQREGYPDYKHSSGARLELKLLYVDNPALEMKRPPTRREPSARLTQKVTVKNVVPATDAMLLVAYQLQPQPDSTQAVSPTIIGIEVLSMIELVEARDTRLAETGGRWFGNFETPCILSNVGKAKYNRGQPLDTSSYGRKESEGKDYNEDTNFGKLQRIPHAGLQAFIRKCLAIAAGEPASRVEARDDEGIEVPAPEE